MPIFQKDDGSQKKTVYHSEWKRRGALWVQFKSPVRDSNFDDRLARVLPDRYHKQSTSGLRTRRKELVAAGFVEPVGRDEHHTRWRITAAGKLYRF